MEALQNLDPMTYIPAIPVLFLLAGLYFTFFAKYDQASNRMLELFNEEKSRQADLQKMQQQQFILKKRNKKNQSPFFQRLDMDMEKANLLLKPSEFVFISIGCSILGSLILFVMGKGLLMSIATAAASLFVPRLYIKLRIFMRMKKAQAQFADVLDMMVSCFKSGYGFTKAVQVVSENFDDPWSTELSKVASEMNFGSTQEDALNSLYGRITNQDVALFVTAVMIQKDTGGNMVELLNNLSNTIRERYKLYSKVSALSAQGKLSAIIVFCIPFGLAGVFTLMMPDMMNNFVGNPIGIGLIVFAIVMQGIGGIVLKRIVSLEV